MKEGFYKGMIRVHLLGGRMGGEPRVRRRVKGDASEQTRVEEVVFRE